jgi:hypothetical protein
VNSSFHDCETLGVATSQGDPPDYEATNTFENLPAGNVGGT